jgi:hypothetical protein
MRRITFLVCALAFVTQAAADTHARGRRQRLSLECALVVDRAFAALPSSSPSPSSSSPPLPREMVFAPAAVALDELARVEGTLVTYAERAQHLGSRFRPWLWVTPVMSGGIYGITVRVDR